MAISLCTYYKHHYLMLIYMGGRSQVAISLCTYYKHHYLMLIYMGGRSQVAISLCTYYKHHYLMLILHGWKITSGYKFMYIPLAPLSYVDFTWVEGHK